MNDFKFALRQVLKNPGFTAAAVLTLALGIGANTAVFSFVNALLVRPLPFRDPEQLVRIHATHGGEIATISRAELLDIQEQSGVFEDIAAYVPSALYNASGDGQRPEELPALIVTHNLWRVLGVPLFKGQSWPAEADLVRDFNVVLSHGLWLRRYAGQTNVLGTKLTLDAAPFYLIQGVAPPGFDFPARVEIYRSMGIRAFERKRDYRNVFGVGRLKPGVTLAQAQAAVGAVGQRLEQTFPETNRGVGLGSEPLRDVYVGKMRPYLRLLAGAVVLVLLLAAANIINLLLSRALAREREIAVRLALGAGRGRLIGQLLTESALLALLGSLAGVAFAFGLVRLLGAALPNDLPAWMRVSVDGRVLGFTFIVAILVGLITGFVPALQLSRPNLAESLKEGTRGSSSGHGGVRFRRWLVTAEIAAAMVLLIGAGLTVRSFANLRRADLGFSSGSLFTFRVALGWRAYTNQAAIIQFFQRMVEKLAAEPGVTAVALNSHTPLTRSSVQQPHTLEGQSLLEQQKNPWLNQQRVSPGYFQVMKIPLLRGREFGEQDREGAPPVAMVSARTASRLWPGQNPIGKRVKAGGPESKSPWLSVVGVAANVKHAGAAAEDELTIYLSYWQFPEGNGTLLARTAVPSLELTSAAARLVESIDANQSAFDVVVMDERVRATIWTQQLAGSLFSLFAVLSIALAGVGIYGVMSYAVSQRTREIGVRMALGASSRMVSRQVVGDGMKMVMTGVGAGLLVAFGATRWIASLIYGLSSGDPGIFTATPLLLGLIALVACYVPARRAARVDPMEALRHE
ncbi:MAG: ABC transporter permease [Verrucomicrobiales bacterium]|nr:ABC transporter permease [Verrucomicrobiales bacterium]